jgi:hypothetical protein
MPLSGTLDTKPLLDTAPRVDGYTTEPWELPGCELLHLKFEIDESNMTGSLPPALHPTIPPVVVVTVATYPESPVGPFSLAQVRLGCRASALPRGFLLRAYSDSQRACDELSSRWGFDVRPADVRLRRFHDRVVGSVTLDGAEILRASLVDPEPISGGDIQYVASMHLARTPDDNGRGALIQVDPEYKFHRAERGEPQLSFDRAAWRAEGVEPVWPVAATFALVDTGFPKIRYVLDPTLPAIAGTRKVE